MLYYTKNSVITGQLAGDEWATACGLTIEANRRFYHMYRDKERYRVPLRVELNEPPLSKVLKSRRRAFVRIHFDDLHRVRPEDLCEVGEHHLPVLWWLLKREWWSDFSTDQDNPADVKKIKGELVAKMSILLQSGQWVDNPESQEMKNLQSILRKIDLGRRTDLKYSSQQDEKTKAITRAVRKINHKERMQEEAFLKRASLENKELVEKSPVTSGPLDFRSYLSKFGDEPVPD